MEDKVRKDNYSVRAIAWMLVVLMVINIISPTMVMAENNVGYYNTNSSAIQLKKSVDSTDVIKKNTESKQLQMPGSPDQPEVVSFTPMGTSDMVNPFTGDFSYNIPLLEVDGYPINIAYNAGITMDQEATWIGLGWNLNPGVVNRAMRGLPDDFNGTEKIEKSFNMKKDWTVGVGAGLGVELFGFGKKKVVDGDTMFENNFKLNASLGVNYNNYNGFGADVSLAPSLSLAKKDKPEMNFSLGLSGSSTGGATISPSFSFKRESMDFTSEKISTTKKSFAIGSSLNSRAGLGDITMNLSYSRKKSVTDISRKLNPDLENSSFRIKGGSSFNFGMSTYTPQISMPMNSFGITFSFKAGMDFFGMDGTWDVKGYFHSQWLKENSQTRAAYGYLNLQKGQNSKMAMMDFNRENDGSFTRYTPALPIPSLTYDIFSVSGQGVGGSYRAYRPDLGYLFDPHQSTTSVNASAGMELATGGSFKAGVDVSGTYSNSNSGVWNTMNNVNLQFNSTTIPFREANEMSVNQDLALYNAIGGAEPVRFVNNTHLNLKNTLVKQDGTELSDISNYNRVNKEKRNQVIYTLTHDQVKKGFGIEALHPQAYTGTTDLPIDHHIAQFTTLNTDGTRYVYGIAAYNLVQNDVSFAIGAKISGNGALSQDCSNGLVTYTPNVDNSLNNDKGLDNYYNSVKTPAYAHSYLLTCVLNADYIDVDQIKGPSKGDVGGFVKFSYEKVDNFKWRNVVQENKASYDEGLNSNLNDDKAHYTYGEKELWYVTRIETKNHVLLFYTSSRDDAPSIIDENGGLDNSKSMKKLDKIELYSLPEYEANPSTAVPLKTVHFEYDYSLCPNYPSNINGGGKLTLKKVFFTYQKSQKGRYNPYVFEYGQNPSYDLKSVDRWGNYKPRPTTCGNIGTDPLRPSDFPYVGFNKTETDLNVSAWNLSAINLPSGGRIEVEYESDDYTYVQHKKATQMFKIIGVQFQSGSNTSNIETTGAVSVSNDNIKNALLYFELMPGYDTPDKIGNYLNGIENLYFRALMKYDDGKFDFVPGYAELDGSFTPQIVTLANGTKAGCIKLKGQTLMDNGSSDYNPIAVAGIQFGRMQLCRLLPPGGNDIDDGIGLADLGNALVSAFKSYGEMFSGPNIPLYSAKFGTDLVIGKVG
ncbi:MAG: hypothetical protein HYR91_15445 [Flavobacteriia bacterium]|nr:hypothetical protein [Flavobacteriia bacterium]